MNAYLVDDQQIVIAVDCLNARKHLAKEREDNKYMSASDTYFRRLSKIEKNNLLIYNNLTYNRHGTLLSTHLEDKVGIENEIIKEDYWSYKD